jgi:hypothetical protein
MRLCGALRAPPRLVAHLTLVHDVAVELIAALDEHFPGLNLDREAVLFGAATHDLGKVVHPDELTAPGTRHEAAGEALLIAHGVAPALARFARTHGSWDFPDTSLEDLLVALSDVVWKGKRVSDLDSGVAGTIATATARKHWEVWSDLDDILERLAAGAEDRLQWQRMHSTRSDD